MPLYFLAVVSIANWAIWWRMSLSSIAGRPLSCAVLATWTSIWSNCSVPPSVSPMPNRSFRSELGDLVADVVVLDRRPAIELRGLGDLDEYMEQLCGAAERLADAEPLVPI